MSRADWIAVGALLLISIFVLSKVIIGGNSVVVGMDGTDVRGQYFAWRSFGYDSLAEGTIPLWNPHIYCGTPFHAGIQGAVLYPLGFIYLFLPTALGINYSVLLHLFLAGFFTYLFARYLRLGPIPSFIAGLAFMLSHPYFFHIFAGHLSNLSTMIWTPLILLFVEMLVCKRKWWLSLVIGSLLTVQLFAGHPQYFIYSCVGVGLYFLLRCIAEIRDHSWRVMLPLLSIMTGAAILAFLLSAAQLLPAAELAGNTARQSTASKLWAGAFSFPPENLLTFVAPDFLGRGTSSQASPLGYWGRNYIWEMSSYLGITTLLLCVYAITCRRNRHTWSLLVLAVVTLLLAMGKFTPLFHILYTVVPGYGMFRGNSKFIYLTALSLSVLGGYGAEAFLSGEEKALRLSRHMRWAVVGLFVAIAVGLALLLDKNGSTWQTWRQLVVDFLKKQERYFALPQSAQQLSEFARATLVMLRESIAALLFIVAGIAVLIFARAKRELPRNLICALLLLVLTCELLYHDWHTVRSIDTSAILWEQDLVKELSKQKSPLRLWIPPINHPAQPRIDDVMTVGFDAFEGYDANVIGYYSEYGKTLAGLPLDNPNVFMSVRKPQSMAMMNALNVNAVLLPASIGKPFSVAKQVWLSTKGSLALYQMPGLPRAWMVHQSEKMVGWNQMRNTLLKDFHPRKTVLLYETPSKQLGHPDDRETPRYELYEPHRSLIRVNAKSPGWLVVSDAFYPGWEVYHNGKSAEVLRANHAFRAVEITDTGDVEIDMVYDPSVFKLGIFLSLGALCLTIMLGTLAIAKRRQN